MQKTELLDALAWAAAFIEHGWCRGMLAKDERGGMVMHTDPQAVQWCGAGAALAGAHEADLATSSERCRLLRLLFGLSEKKDAYNAILSFSHWNDESGSQAKLLSVISDAAHRLGSK